MLGRLARREGGGGGAEHRDELAQVRDAETRVPEGDQAAPEQVVFDVLPVCLAALCGLYVAYCIVDGAVP